MAEEEKKESKGKEAQSGEQTPEEGSAKKKSKLPLMMIIISIAAFAICIGVFSFMMGIFPSASDKSQGDEEAAVADSPRHSKKKMASGKKHKLTEIEALEAELFDTGGFDDVEDMDDLLKLVEDREAMAEKDSLESVAWLDTEKAKLKSERTELDTRQKELDLQEYRLTQMMEKVNQVTAARVGSLAKLYDGMKPQQVAPLINKLTDEQSVMVLLKMKPANAAKILGALTSDRAARISSQMITLAEEN